MRIVYMGKDKPSTVAGLKYLIQKGIEVPVVVAPLREQSVFGGPTLADTAHAFGIPTATDEELYYCLRASNGVAERGYALHDVDLVVSFLFWKKIRRPLIDLPRIGCINLHPAPLPDFRGLGGYNFAIYEGAPSWGVSAHFVDESFDTGDIIKVRTFDIDPSEETAYSLEQKSQTMLVELFKQVVDIACETGSLPRFPQGEGRYITKQDFERLKRIQPGDTVEQIERKIRAFWYPPFAGASIEIQGKTFTLVSEEVLAEIGRMYHRR
jgi:methionyl-tRNA formyltransferase